MNFNSFGKDSDKPKRSRILAHHKTEILKRQGKKCAKCNKKLEDHPKNYHIDHIKPLADGGKDIPSNMQALCGSCHTQKSYIEQGKRAERRRKENKTEKDPYADFLGTSNFLGSPKPGSNKSKDPHAGFLDASDFLGAPKSQKRKGKKDKEKDPFSIF